MALKYHAIFVLSRDIFEETAKIALMLLRSFFADMNFGADTKKAGPRADRLLLDRKMRSYSIMTFRCLPSA